MNAFAKFPDASGLWRRAAFAEGKLFDKDGALSATATTTRLVFSK